MFVICLFVFGTALSSCGIKGKPVPPKSSTDVIAQTKSTESVSTTTTISSAVSSPTQQKSKNKKK